MKEFTPSDISSLLRQLPSVDVLLQELGGLIEDCGHQQVTDVVRIELSRLRERINNGTQENTQSAFFVEDILKTVKLTLANNNQATMVEVFNLSGTILHTNLGRAILPKQALEEVVKIAGSASNLEYDLATGKRGHRDTHFEDLVCELTGAEAATAVNNNAAAVLLVLNTLALGKEVPVSRGQLVEIGGSFRIPEVMERSGGILVEVGATNRTHLKDYEKAITRETALLLKVHTSNYRIEGFASEVSERELAELAKQHQLPFVIDMGSGSLIDFKKLGLPAEPTAAEAIANGADIITFSGDKLLGGPQCGIIAGRKDLLDRIRLNPLKRALRLDKMTLAALTVVLKMYRNPDKVVQELPTLRHLTRKTDDIHRQAERLLPLMQSALPEKYTLTVTECKSQIGSGALPIDSIPSIALRISSTQDQDTDIRKLADVLRQLPIPIIGRIHKGMVLLDLRCLDHEDEFIEQLPVLREHLQ